MSFPPLLQYPSLPLTDLPVDKECNVDALFNEFFPPGLPDLGTYSTEVATLSQPSTASSSSLAWAEPSDEQAGKDESGLLKGLPEAGMGELDFANLFSFDPCLPTFPEWPVPALSKSSPLPSASLPKPARTGSMSAPSSKLNTPSLFYALPSVADPSVFSPMHTCPLPPTPAWITPPPMRLKRPAESDEEDPAQPKDAQARPVKRLRPTRPKLNVVIPSTPPPRVSRSQTQVPIRHVTAPQARPHTQPSYSIPIPTAPFQPMHALPQFIPSNGLYPLQAPMNPSFMSQPPQMMYPRALPQGQRRPLVGHR